MPKSIMRSWPLSKSMDILGLDVPVHHTVGVGMFQRL